MSGRPISHAASHEHLIMLFSIIVPVFNRPAEVHDLLQSLDFQSCKDFEVIVVDDGSSTRSDKIVEEYYDRFDIRYYHITNLGPGGARNYGCEHARGDYFIFFDSDCIIPPHYMETVRNYLETSWLDAYGGPDMAHPSFTRLQKAINYTMTSVLTTGGIRGSKISIGDFHPRSFNMGISRKVYEATKGFTNMRFGEDVELSIRIKQRSFTTGLIQDAYVYHRRREDLKSFFKQVYNFGIARVNLYKRHSQALQPTHMFPAIFTLGCAMLPVFGLLSRSLFGWLTGLYVVYTLLILIDASLRTRDLAVGALSIVAAYVQLIGYGSGFLDAVWRRLIRGGSEFAAFQRNFYD
jgi:glycosyltransferase involved in cell wall biosynthesis